MTVSLEDIGEAYLDLLRMPLASPERQLHAQKAMCVLRDIIAERTGRSRENVQTSFENMAAFRAQTKFKTASPIQAGGAVKQ